MLSRRVVPGGMDPFFGRILESVEEEVKRESYMIYLQF